MNNTIHQIVYMSRATATLDDNGVAELCDLARINNSRLGITGLLLYDGARFMQALEGSLAAVTEVMRGIRRDPRHRSISYVRRGPVARRQFGNWAMNFHHVQVTQDARCFLDSIRRAIGPLEDLQLIASFVGFAVLGRPELRAERRDHLTMHITEPHLGPIDIQP